MLNQNGFDAWADEYQQTVVASDEENRYPFAGYGEVLDRIFQIVARKENAAVLDIGFGTGELTARLYEHGCTVFGQDFSVKMIDIASAKMPEARLYQGDFAAGLAEPLLRQRYDFIIATYALHHLTDEQKFAFLHGLTELLNENGQILIGDIAFRNRDEWGQCRTQVADKWDDEEFYFIADELNRSFPKLMFEPVSFCSGVFRLTR